MKRTDIGGIDDVISGGARRITEEDARRVASGGASFRRKMDASPSSFIEKVGAKLELLLSAVRDYMSGSYREVPWLTIALATFAILYFLNPADVFPDILPLTGFIDDAGIIAAAYAAITRDLNRYEAWKKDQGREADSGESPHST